MKKILCTQKSTCINGCFGIIAWIHRHICIHITQGSGVMAYTELKCNSVMVDCLVKQTSSMSELSKKREHQCQNCSRTAGTLFNVRCVIHTVLRSTGFGSVQCIGTLYNVHHLKITTKLLNSAVFS